MARVRTAVCLVMLALACGAALGATVPPRLGNTSVSLPWSDFKELLERSKPADAKPPVDYVFSPATYTVTIAGERAAVSAACDVTVLTDRWTLVDFGRASNVAAVTADGKPCPLVMRNQRLNVLLSGKGVKKLALTMECEVKDAGLSQQVTVDLLPSAVVTVSLRVPKGGLEVAAAGVRFKIAEHNKTTTATATFRGGQALTLSWYARPPKPRKLPARLYADTQTLVRVEQGLVRCTATIDFAILRSPVKQFKVDVPADFEFIRAQGEHVAATSLSEIRDPRARTRTATIDLRRGAIGRHTLTLVYERRLKKDETKLAVGVPSPLNVVQRRGSVGVAVHGGLEVTAVASSDARPVDVKKLPAALWGRATAPLIRGFRYDAGSPTVRLTVTQHKQVAVLVAMSDACEASTVVTPEGRVITKVMYILRNNQKQFMKLDLPEGATVWSTFVQDRPVTPVRNEAGQLLIPLRKSEEVTEEDEEEGKTYRWRRDKRRSDRRGELRVARERMQRAKRLERADEPPKDLKPYDVEIVFVTPNVKLDARGNVKLALPKADIPVGLMAWAVFLPQKLRVVDVAGNLKEVSRFALPFRHFGEAELMRREALATAQKAVVRAMLAEQLKELRRDTVRLAPHAKGALPVRIEIPITGAIQRFQKFLLVNEAPQVTLTYRRRAD